MADALTSFTRRHFNQVQVVRSELFTHGGREVKHTGDGIMAAFTSVVSAVTLAMEVQRRLHKRNQKATTPFDISIGISAGEPN